MGVMIGYAEVAGNTRVDSAIADSTNAIQNKAIYLYTRSNNNLVTTSKDIVGAINEIDGKVNSMSGVITIEVVTARPTTPVENTMYYVGSASPYHIWLYANSTWYDFGTTSVDLSQYVLKSNIVDSLTDTSTDKPLSANQGRTLDVNKVNIDDIVNDLTTSASDKPLSAQMGKALNEGKVGINTVQSDENFSIGMNDGKVTIYGDTHTVEIDDTSNLLPKSGGTMTGAITMSGNAIQFGTGNKELKANGDALQYAGLTLPSIVTTAINGTTDVNGNYRLTTPTGYTNYLFVGCKGSCQWSGTSWTAEVTYTCMMDGYYINITIPNGTSVEPQKNKAVQGSAYWLVW